MNRTIIKMGRSLGAVIPKGVLEHFNLEVGDQIDFRIEKDHIKAMPVHPSAKMNVQTAQHPAIGEGNV
jgi:antitoxin component of MazEF toxin-antitoxin module